MRGLVARGADLHWRHPTVCTAHGLPATPLERGSPRLRVPGDASAFESFVSRRRGLDGSEKRYEGRRREGLFRYLCEGYNFAWRFVDGRWAQDCPEKWERWRLIVSVLLAHGASVERFGRLAIRGGRPFAVSAVECAGLYAEEVDLVRFPRVPRLGARASHAPSSRSRRTTASSRSSSRRRRIAVRRRRRTRTAAAATATGPGPRPSRASARRSRRSRSFGAPTPATPRRPRAPATTSSRSRDRKSVV